MAAGRRDDVSEQEIARDRLAVLEAVLHALDRRAEVAEVIASAETEEGAVDAVKRLLGISRVHAIEVLNLQLRRTTRSGHADIRRRRDEVRRAVQDHADP